MCVYTKTLPPAYGTMPATVGTAKGRRARRPGLKDCRMRCSASRRMLASGRRGARTRQRRPAESAMIAESKSPLSSRTASAPTG